MARWEYAGRLFYGNMNDAQKDWMIGRLSEMGEQGWELVGIHDDQAIFKRMNDGPGEEESVSPGVAYWEGFERGKADNGSLCSQKLSPYKTRTLASAWKEGYLHGYQEVRAEIREGIHSRQIATLVEHHQDALALLAVMETSA